jgi:DNA-directed RNA polymerase specialized sigma24 family protein
MLVHRTVAGDTSAWVALQIAIEPTIVRIARGHRGLRSRGLAELPDDVAEIRTSVLERLARDDFRNLRSFVEHSARAETHTAESFDVWLYGIVDFVVREHLRKRYGRAPKPSAEEPQRVRPSKRDLQSHAGRLDEQSERVFLQHLTMTAQLTVAEIFAFIAGAFAPAEAEAMRLYYREDLSFEELAAKLELPSAKAAEQLVRRLNARLRYRFMPASE